MLTSQEFYKEYYKVFDKYYPQKEGFSYYIYKKDGDIIIKNTDYWYYNVMTKIWCWDKEKAEKFLNKYYEEVEKYFFDVKYCNKCKKAQKLLDKLELTEEITINKDDGVLTYKTLNSAGKILETRNVAVAISNHLWYRNSMHWELRKTKEENTLKELYWEFGSIDEFNEPHYHYYSLRRVVDLILELEMEE